MNAYELAELRIMLNSIDMKAWTIRLDPPHNEDDILVHGGMNGVVTGILYRQPFYLNHPDSGEAIDIYREMDWGGKPVLWQVGMRYIKSHDAWEYRQRNPDLKLALSNLNIQLHKAGIA